MGLSPSLDIDSRYLISVLGGLLVLLIFAGDQLNRHAIEAHRHRQEVLNLARPSDFRSAGAFFKAYLLYALLLSSLYVAACFLSPTLMQLALQGESAGLSLDPKVKIDQLWLPPSLSLALIGLMPLHPFFRRVEAKFRRFAHRMVGIPEALWRMTDLVRSLEVERAGALRLALRGGAAPERIARWAQAARGRLGMNAEQHQRLADSLTRVAALRLWLVDGTGAWPSGPQRERFDRLARALAEKHDILTDDLDLLTGDDRMDPAKLGSADKRWRAVVETATELDDQFCALFALHVETAPRADRPEAGPLASFLAAYDARRETSQADFDVVTGVTLKVCATGFAGG